MAVRLSDIPNTSVRLSDVSVGTRLSDIPETQQIDQQGLSPFAQVGEQQELQETTEDFQPAVFDLPGGVSRIKPDAPPPIGFTESIKRTFTTPARGAQKIPGLGGLFGTAENLLFLDAADRLNKGFDYNQPVFPERIVPGALGTIPPSFTTKERDQQLLDELIIRTEREQAGFTFGGAVAQGLLNLPTWMAEFAMTGGLANLGSEVAKKAGEKLIGRWAKTKAGETALKAAGWTGGAITRATLGLGTRVTEKATRRQVEVEILDADQEGWATSFAKAWGDVVIESASETAGEAITGIPVKLLKKTKLGSKFINGLQAGWTKLTGGTTGQFIKKITAKGGYSNLLGEYGEERLGTLLRGITGVEDFGAGPNASITERLKAGFKQDISNIGVELTVLSAIPGSQVILGQAARAITPAEKPAGVAIPKAGLTPAPTAVTTTPVKPPVRPVQPAKPKIGIKVPPTAIKPVAKPTAVPVKQIEVSDTEAAALLGESLEKIKANRELKAKLSKELVITDFQPSDFVPKTKKGPGLTKAEQRIVTPEVQGKLRFAQTQGLPVGFKAGQKEANDIAKRRLDDFRTVRKVEKGILQDARKLVTEYAKDPVVAKKLITSLAKVDSPAKMAAFADKIGEFVREAERKQAITSYKTTFNQLKKDNRLGKVAFGKLRGAARKRILKFADTIDLKKLSVAKKEELESLMSKVKDLGVDLSEGIAQLDVDTQDALKQLDPHIVALGRLKKTAVSDMGLEEIQIAEDSLRYIVRQNEIQNKEIFGKRTRDLAETETQAVKEVSVSKKQKKIFAKEIKKGVVAPFKKTGVFAKGKEGLITQSETIPTLIQTSTVKGATATKDVLDTKTHDGLRETNKIQFESVDFLKQQYSKHNITPKTLASFDNKFEVIIGGKKRSVDADDLGGIEMHLRSLDNLEQLRKTKAIWIQGKRVTDFTIQELVGAVDKLTPSQLKTLDIAGLQNRKITAPAVNETSESLWGYPIARDTNYWPLVRKLPQKVGGAVIDFSTAVEQQSPFQPRTGGTADIIIVPFRQQMWQTIQTGARFGGTAVPFHNARGLLNSKKWQNAMIESGRKAEMDAIIKIFRRTQGVSSDKNALELSFQSVLSNVAKSKLSLRPSTPLVQAASFPIAFSEIPAKYAFPLKGFKVQSGKTQLSRLKKFSPTTRLRFEGGRMSPEVGNISASEGLNMLVFNKTSITTKPLIPLRKVDQATILAIDKMVQRMMRDTTGLKGDAFWEAVSLETERVTRFTQPMWDHFDRSVNLTSPNILLRSGLAFRAPREAMLNTAIRGRDVLAKGEKAKFARSWGAVFSSVLMARLIKLTTKVVTVGGLAFLLKGRFPKREKEFSDFAADIAKDIVNILPFGEIINPAVDVAIKGKTLRQAEFNNLLGDFVKTAATVAVDGTRAARQAADGDTEKAKESLKKATIGTIQTAAEVKGLPFTGPRDIIKPALKEPTKTGTFGRTRPTRTRPTRTRPTRTRKTRTFGRKKDG